MATSRKVLVDRDVIPFDHCISRCVWRVFLSGEENLHRKQWIEDRLKELFGIFAIDVCGFAILDNHLHVLLRFDYSRAKGWSAEVVVRQWIELCPPKDRYRKPVIVAKSWTVERASNLEWVEERRERLTDLGWTVKSLKALIARRANHDNECAFTFWEGRFRIVAILDELSLLTTSADMDLNPVTSGAFVARRSVPQRQVISRLPTIGHC